MKQTATILIVALCVVCATMISGCLDSEYEETEDEPYVFVAQTPRIPAATPTTPTPAPKLELIDILFNDMVANDVANKDHYSMEGGSKDVHICGNMAVEQAEWIRDNYEYKTGVVLLWCKYQGDSHAQTWVIIDDERYVIESTSDKYWTEDEHNNEFGEFNKICFVPISKGKEHTKSSAEYYRSGT